MARKKNEARKTPESTKPIMSAPGEKGHDEHLLDESIEESFPTSDPPSSVVPGSLLSQQNTASSGTGKLRIAIILGSTRPNRNGEAVARWAHGIASNRGDAEFELVDIRHYNLPLLDEPVSPMLGKYSQPHTRLWAAKIEAFDAFVFVTPEYNHGTSAALKNALDFLYAEWNNKAAGFVSYGSACGVRAVEQLRLVMAELQVADVREQVMLSLYTDFEKMSVFKPGPHQEPALNSMLQQVVAWGSALRQLRRPRAGKKRPAAEPIEG